MLVWKTTTDAKITLCYGINILKVVSKLTSLREYLERSSTHPIGLRASIPLSFGIGVVESIGLSTNCLTSVLVTAIVLVYVLAKHPRIV